MEPPSPSRPCEVCRGAFVPIRLSCSHIFCALCFGRYISLGLSRCPDCGANTEHDAPESLPTPLSPQRPLRSQPLAPVASPPRPNANDALQSFDVASGGVAAPDSDGVATDSCAAEIENFATAPTLINLMHTFTADVKLATSSCGALLGRPTAECLAARAPDAIVALLARNGADEDTCVVAATVLQHLAVDEVSAFSLVSAGCPSALARVLCAHEGSAAVAETVSSALCTILRFSGPCRAATDTPAVLLALLAALGAHVTDAAVCVRALSGVLCILRTNVDARDFFVNDGPSRLVGVLRAHPGALDVCTNAALALALVCAGSEEEKDATVAAGALPACMELLGGPLAREGTALSEHVVRALSFVASGNSVMRLRALLTAGAAGSCVDVLRTATASAVCRSAALRVLSLLAAFDGDACVTVADVPRALTLALRDALAPPQNCPLVIEIMQSLCTLAGSGAVGAAACIAADTHRLVVKVLRGALVDGLNAGPRAAAACSALAALATRGDASARSALLAVDAPRALVEAARSEARDAAVVYAAASALSALAAGDGGCVSAVVGADATRTLVELIRGVGVGDSRVAARAIHALLNIACGDDVCVRALFLADSFLAFCEVLATHGATSAAMCEDIAHAVWHAARRAVNEKGISNALLQSGVARALVGVMRTHAASPTLCEAVCGAITALSKDAGIRDVLVTCGAATVVVAAARTHLGAVAVAESACAAMASFLEGVDGARFAAAREAVIVAEAPRALVLAAAAHQHSAIVLQAVTGAFSALAAGDARCRAALLAADVPRALVTALTEHVDDALVTKFALGALSALAGAGGEATKACVEAGAVRALAAALLGVTASDGQGARDVYEAACVALDRIGAGDASGKAALLTADIPHLLISTARAFFDVRAYSAVQRAVAILGTLAQGGGAGERTACVEAGAVEALVEVLSPAGPTPLIQTSASTLRALLSGDDVARARAVACGAPRALADAVMLHKTSPGVCEAACGAIGAVAEGDKEDKEACAAAGAPRAIVTAMRLHARNAGVASAGARALRSIASGSDACKAACNDAGAASVLAAAAASQQQTTPQENDALKKLSASADETQRGACAQQ